MRGLDSFDVVTFCTEPDTQQAQQTRIVVDEEDLAAELGLLVGHIGLCRMEP